MCMYICGEHSLKNVRNNGSTCQTCITAGEQTVSLNQ